jgi:hypothetical protein
MINTMRKSVANSQQPTANSQQPTANSQQIVMPVLIFVKSPHCLKSFLV